MDHLCALCLSHECQFYLVGRRLLSARRQPSRWRCCACWHFRLAWGRRWTPALLHSRRAITFLGLGFGTPSSGYHSLNSPRTECVAVGRSYTIDAYCYGCPRRCLEPAGDALGMMILAEADLSTCGQHMQLVAFVPFSRRRAGQRQRFVTRTAASSVCD